jgi:hypothetical protein
LLGRLPNNVTWWLGLAESHAVENAEGEVIDVGMREGLE